MSLGGLREAMQNAQKSGQFLQNIDERTELMVKRLESIGIDLDLRLNELKVITETINKKVDIIVSLEISNEKVD